MVLRSLSLDAGYKEIGKQMFQDILKVAKNQQDWRAVTPIECYDPARTARRSALAHVGVSYKKDATRDMVIVRVSTVLPFTVETVTALLLDLDSRSRWDPRFVRGEKIQRVDKTSDVVHMICKSYSSPYKYRDFVLFRSNTKLDGGGKLLCCRSVLHPKGPECKDSVRAVLFPTGYIVTPTQYTQEQGGPVSPAGQYCMLTYIAQMDREAVLTVTPDLLGETDELSQSIANITTLLTHQAAAAPQPIAIDPLLDVKITPEVEAT